MKINEMICAEAREALQSLPDASIDLVVTDPPYLCNYRDRTGRKIANDDNPEAVLCVFDALNRVMKPNSYCVSFYGWTAIAAFAAAWKRAGFRTVGHIVWTKPYASRKGFAQYKHESAFVLAKGKPRKPEAPISDVQEWRYTGNRSHPTEKAVSVLSPLVRCYSKPGDLVLDPFAGVGSTLVAAALNGRNYLGVELEAKYCALANKRLNGVHRKQSAKRAA